MTRRRTPEQGLNPPRIVEIDDTAPLSKRYLGVLILAAAIIIALGLLARDSILGSEAADAAPPSEASALQRLSQENQLRGMSTFINERVAAVSAFVVRIPALDASGIRWGNRDTVVTTAFGRPVVSLQTFGTDTLRAPFALETDSVRRDWMLIVARDAGERVISWYGISGGRATSRCGQLVLDKFVLGFPIAPEFAGGGVFDLLGRARGMVVNCGDSFAAIPASEVIRLLSDTTTIAPATDSLPADTTR